MSRPIDTQATPKELGSTSLYTTRAMLESGPAWITRSQLVALVEAVEKSYRCYCGDISAEALNAAGDAYARFDWSEFDV